MDRMPGPYHYGRFPFDGKMDGMHMLEIPGIIPFRHNAFPGYAFLPGNLKRERAKE
jgi:hypothetical protein